MALDPIVRAQVLRDLAAIIDRHKAGPNSGHGPVVEAMHSAGCGWTDLLAHPGRDPEYTAGLIRYGHGRTSGITTADAGAAVLRLAAWCSPFTLAAVAAAVHLSSTNPARTLDHLFDLVLTLAAAADCGGTGPHPIAWVPPAERAFQTWWGG